MTTQNKHKSIKILHVVLQGVLLTALLCWSPGANAITRTSVASGPFNSANTWYPAGIPATADNIVIASGNTVSVNTGAYVSNLTVQSGGKLDWSAANMLTINGSLTVHGTLDNTGGNISFPNAGNVFTIGAGGTVVWNPLDNTTTGASLFINSIENFDPASTLIIKQWFNYQSVPLTSLVTGDFGNLTLTTLSGGLMFEWNQKNGFETHRIHGKLTVDQGWIVFDNTGSISNTQIGSIELKNINSYLDFHTGDHPGTFTVTTGSITNIGGTLNGINNGDGNIHLNVTGDIINVGYMVLNYNSGLIGKGNGNVTMDVGGTYRQPGGDFRGIFNLSSTTAGTVRLNFHDAEITGGQFMGMYSCHTSGATSQIHFRGNLKISLLSSQGKFRGNGLTSLGGTNSNAGLEFTVDGKLNVSGHAAADILTSGASGQETFTVKSNSYFTGAQFALNMGSHNVVAEFNAPLTINGGTFMLSQTGGTLTGIFNDSITVRSGIFVLKGENGPSTVVMNGPYTQSGGNVWLYSNASQPAVTPVNCIINNNFNQSGGHLTFDSNPASTTTHKLTLGGESFTVSDSAYIGSANTNGYYGLLEYGYPGTMQYHSTGSAWTIRQVKQQIKSGCILKPVTGTIVIASSATYVADLFQVNTGATLDLGDAQIRSNALQLNSGLRAASGSVIRLSRQQGFYDGSQQAAVSAAGNITCSLDENSTVEYYGAGPVTLTGTGTGTANNESAQYGILKINLDNNTAIATAASDYVIARTKVLVQSGILDLSSKTVTVSGGLPGSVSTVNGMIRSEGDGKIKVLQPKAGIHGWNFCTASNKPLPFALSIQSNSNSYLSVSTQPCSEANFPYPAPPAGGQISNLNVGGSHAANRMIDRWFKIEAPAVSGTLTLSFASDENTLPSSLTDDNIAITCWKNTMWTEPEGQRGTGSNNMSVTATMNTITGIYAMVAWPENRQANLLTFTAEKVQQDVMLKWKVNRDNDARNFTAERSVDGTTYIPVGTVSALPSGQEHAYDIVDKNPLSGASWYRIKQYDYSGMVRYSQAVRITLGKNTEGQITITSVTPNPFHNQFSLVCDFPEPGPVTIQLLSSGGQLIDTKNYSATDGANTFSWEDNRNLPEGIYILIVSDGKRKSTSKIYKH
ncbi:MAG TPA: T9SS type A sorting domain-containing protein [Bacteroidia bacterium]|nr:T9SS type A sorting domain-containing protein [Bacteroidia bacterium]